MKTTNTIVLLLIAAAVAAAVYFQKQKNENAVTSAAIPERTIPAVTSGTLERIIIRPPGEKAVTLTQVNGQWFANPETKYEADQQAVENAIKALSEPINASVVSTNPDSFEEYQLTDTTATKVQMFNRGEDKPEISLLIGKDGPSAFTTYVRLPDTQEVLNARAALSMAFKRPDGWRKREIFSFPSSNATQVVESGTSGTYTLAKAAEDKWTLTAPEQSNTDQTAASSIINMMSSLRAGEFVDLQTTQTLASLGLEPARQTIAVGYDDKTTSPSRATTATLLVGNKADDNNNWYAKASDKPDVFTLGQPVIESLTPALDDIKVDPPPPAELETTATLAAEPVSTATAPVAQAPSTTETATTETPAPDNPTTATAPAATETTAPAP